MNKIVRIELLKRFPDRNIESSVDEYSKWRDGIVEATHKNKNFNLLENLISDEPINKWVSPLICRSSNFQSFLEVLKIEYNTGYFNLEEVEKVLKPELVDIPKIGKLGVPSFHVWSETDHIEESWLISKPNITYPNKESLDKAVYDLEVRTNLPVSGFKIYCITAYTSIYFRDLLFCMPNVVPWSQSTRNLEMNSPIYQISTETPKDLMIDHINRLEDCRVRSENGEALDLVKKDLPKSTMMYYSFFIDRRTLITFLKTIDQLAGGDFHENREYLEPMIDRMLDAVGITKGEYETSKIQGIYDKLSFTPEMLDLMDSKSKGRVKSFSHVESILDAYKMHMVYIDFGIAAQFIRQHFSQRRYLEFNNIVDKGWRASIDGNLRGKTGVSVTGDAQSFERTISRRLCWFAAFDKTDPNDDSWALILDEYVKDMDKPEFFSTLPCKGNCKRCDIADEFKLREVKLGDPTLKAGLTSADKNGLCPVLYPNKDALSLLTERYKQQGSNSTTFFKWVEMMGFNRSDLK